MIYKRIGKDKVSAIGVGTYGIYKDEHAEYIKYAIDCGMNLVDTAEEYNDGDSEIIVGRAIKDIRKSIFLSTKLCSENLSYNDVLKSFYLSLKRLNTDYIDLYQIHWPSATIPLEETFSAMQYLIKQGYLRYIGVSNFTFGQLKKSYSIIGENLVSIQNEYSPIERTVEDDTLPFCEDNGIVLIAYSPYKFLRYIEELNQKNVLSLIISHPNVVTLVKSFDKKHIKKNCDELKYINTTIIKKDSEFIPINSIIDFNKNNDYSPTPEDLACDIKKYGILKPLKVIKRENKYEIIEGKLRFLAWCIAKPKKDIPVIVLNNHLSPKHDENVVLNKNDI